MSFFSYQRLAQASPLIFNPDAVHHIRRDCAKLCDDAGLSIKGLDKTNWPHSVDVMVHEKDNTLGQTTESAAQIQTSDDPKEITVDYSPNGFARCRQAACRTLRISWRMGQETEGMKMEELSKTKSNEIIVFASRRLLGQQFENPILIIAVTS